MSRCRAAGDGGPTPVRHRRVLLWGFEGLAGSLQEMFRQNGVLWLRFLLAYAVAQAAADVPFLTPVQENPVRQHEKALTVSGDRFCHFQKE